AVHCRRRRSAAHSQSQSRCGPHHARREFRSLRECRETVPMIRSMCRSTSGELRESLSPEQIRGALQDKTGTPWVGVSLGPETKEHLGIQLRDFFNFHPLAIDDALSETHVPRLDDWNDYLYIVLHALDLEVNQELDTQELDAFLGFNYLVTIHEEPIKALDK